MWQLCLHPASCISDAHPDQPARFLGLAPGLPWHCGLAGLSLDGLWPQPLTLGLIFTQTHCCPCSSLLVRLPELQQGHLSSVAWLWSPKKLPRAENKSQGPRKEGHCSLYREGSHLGPTQELGYCHCWGRGVCWMSTIKVVKKTKPSPSCLPFFSVRGKLGGAEHIIGPGIAHLLF